MKTQHQEAIDNLIETHTKELEQRAIQIRTDLLEVFRALSKVTGKSEVEYWQQIQESVAFRIRLLKGIRRRKVGRPKLNKGIK